jgi:integrase
MAKISLFLDTRKKSPVVKLLINVGSRNSTISLGIPLDSPEQWQPSNPRGPITGHPASRTMNALIQSRFVIAQEVLHSMMLAQEPVTLDTLKAKIITAIDPDKAEKQTPKDTLLEWVHRYQSQTHGRTRELYNETEKRISEFAIFHVSGIDPRNDLDIHRNPTATKRGEEYLIALPIQDITPKWLEAFDLYLSKTMGTNARAIHLRNIRAILKNAIRNDIDLKDPFLKFKIRREDTRHRALTPEQFRTLFTYKIPEKEKELIEYRDIALLIFLLIGINVADLFEATEFMNGRLEYNRRKTHRHYSIKVEPEAAAIFKKYRGKRHLLKYADTNISHISLTKKLDKALKRIGPVTYDPSPTRNHQPFKQWHGLFPDISVYWLRHTWATFAAKLGIPRDTIAKCLGHGKKTVTDIYIDFDQEVIDLANRKVIDYALTLIK